MGWIAMVLIFTAGGTDSPIKSDETVVFFPTFGQRAQEGENWDLSIHGWIFEPEEDSPMRRAALGLFRRSLGLKKEDEETEIFKRRARAFLVDNERGKKLSIRLGEKTYPLEESDARGHFTGTVQLSAAQAKQLLESQKSKHGWLAFEAVTRPEEERTFRGRVQLIDKKGIAVISDIDDTVKISEVAHPKTLLKNTFLREFEAVPGMAGFYEELAGKGASFHYVSASPWQLYAPLEEFLRDQGFPQGSMHLRTFRWKDSSFFNLFASPEKTKNQAIEPILAAFPKRNFVLIGDSGEKDPEIYGSLARKYPRQIVRILIREVSEEDNAGRYQKAFEGLDARTWKIFRDPKELESVTKELFHD